MTTESMPAATPSALVGDIACAAVLKCPSPVTLAAAHIARQMGVLTDFSVPGAAGDEPPSLRVGNANGSILVFELEKENVCPVTGVYARLASGEGASGPGDTASSFDVAFAETDTASESEPGHAPLADVTIGFTLMERLKPGRVVLRSTAQGTIASITPTKRVRCSCDGAGPDDSGDAKRVLRFVIR